MLPNYRFDFRFLDFLLVWSVCQGIPNNNSRIENGLMLAAGSSQSRVYVINLVTGDVIGEIQTPTPTGVWIDETRQVVYRAEYFQRRIVRFCLQRCQNNEKIIATGDGQPEHVAVDFSTGNVYFSAIAMTGSRESSYIGVFDPDKTTQRRIITGLNQPRAMALYPAKGIMFWCDYGANIIERTSMDGTDRNIIGRNNCVGLSIDYTEDLLYYGDFNLGEIAIANFDGIKLRTLVRDARIEDVLINGPHVYYSRLDRRPAIVKVSKESGRTISFLNNRTDLGRIQSIDVVPRDLQPVNAPCTDRNGLCSRLCLPSPEGRTCACQDGVGLLDDGITCEGDIRCPTSIPNGYLDSSCTSFPGETCNFTCNNYLIRLPVPNITCLESGNWDPEITLLCNDIRCPTSIPNGYLDTSCTRFPGETCNFTCDNNFNRLPVPNITCLESRNWDQEITLLCTAILCPTSIPNGYLDTSCTRFPGETCNFTCNNSFNRLPVPNITCLESGNWDPEITLLCTDIRCPTSIPNGYLDTSCTSFPGETCNFTCNNSLNRLPVPTINCLESGNWDPEITLLCTVLPETNGLEDNNTIVILSVVIAVTVLLIILVLTVCYITKRKRITKKEQNMNQAIYNIDVTMNNYQSLNDGYQSPVELDMINYKMEIRM